MKKRILLVEDHPGTIEVMQQELEVLGYEVTLAENGVKAVEMATSESPDLIVMDIVMPKMDGLQAASQIRKNPKTKDIPILAATALARPGDREKCLEGGCDGYIAKPFTHKQLGVAIEKLFEK
ncbi:MAG: response regulator [Deltaproteobacteria bacterium]|nr:response regulator [Deltaproteobacteria bacterium]MCZ6623928.1 response regulator [Deltaproteobacteria bacterium]